MILLFDGVCLLCSTFVHFLLDHNADQRIHFCALQSEPGKDILALYKICKECHLPKMGTGYSGAGLDQYVQACATGLAGPSAGGSSSSSSRAGVSAACIAVRARWTSRRI